jgi:ribosomal protein S18 acetylase RimI-like enzyme
MAAFWHARREQAEFEVCDLKRISSTDLEAVLREEVVTWRTRLHWDFTPSADLVSRYAAIQALDGLALLENGRLTGYSYWVVEGNKALIGDLYIRHTSRTPETENLLLAQTLHKLTAGPHFVAPWLQRIEAQLMAADLRADQVLPEGPAPKGHRRLFMLASTRRVAELPPAEIPSGYQILGWGPRLMDDTAALIAAVYQKHIDSEINDQYRSASGARRFLQNVVQYPGCGVFSPESSFAILSEAGRVCGVSIASRVAPESGHVAQICIAEELQGRRMGYELLRCSMLALAGEDAREVSLTVTASNEKAVRLYAMAGFRTIHEFDALVWDGLS